jgi:hypothetical protein
MSKQSLTSRLFRVVSYPRNRLIVRGAILAFTFTALTVGMRYYRMHYLPIAHPTAHIPDGTKYGNPQASIEQSYKLLSVLKTVDWDPWKAPRELLYLPDRRFSERESVRSGKELSFSFPNLGSKDHPETEPVAFVADLYVRENPAAYNGDKIQTDTAGFYIVGWKDGRVTTVPVKDVRVIVKDGYYIASYPGMPGYDANGMKLPSIEFADGDGSSKKAKAFYASITAKDDTQACRVPPQK